MVEKYSIRTDLALEQKERFEADNVEISGVVLEENYDEEREIKITTVKIETENGAKTMGKPVGTYITIEAPNMAIPDEGYHEEISRELSKFLKTLLKKEKGDYSVLVVGLGNRNVTADALGTRVVERMLVTRHLRQAMARELRGRLRGVSAIAPGVLGLTGIETAELCRGLVRHVRPSAVIAIDALAAFESERICTTVQITDTGIEPGSGVGNHRLGLTEETLGVKVIAVGVPMVVYASTIARDAMARLIDEYGLLARGHEEAAQQLLRQVSEGFLGDMVVTPREIDELVLHVAALLSDGINQALQPDIDPDTLHTYIQG